MKSALFIALSLLSTSLMAAPEDYAQTVRKLSDVSLAGHVTENATFTAWNCGPVYFRKLQDENAKRTRSENIKCEFYANRWQIAKNEVNRRARRELVRHEWVKPKTTEYTFSAVLPVNNHGPVTEEGNAACLNLIRPMFSGWKQNQAWPTVPDIGGQSFVPTRIDCEMTLREDRPLALGACRPFVMGTFLNVQTNTFDLISKVSHVHTKAESDRLNVLRASLKATDLADVAKTRSVINEISKIQLESGHHIFYDLVFKPGSTNGVLELRAVHGSVFWPEQFNDAHKEIIQMRPACKIKMPIAVKSTPVRQK